MPKKKPKKRLFAQIYIEVLESDLYRGLRYSAQALYPQITAAFWKFDSRGRYKLRKSKDDKSVKLGPADVGMPKATFYTAIEDLWIHGFIEIVERGEYPRKKGEYSISMRWKGYERKVREEKEGLRGANGEQPGKPPPGEAGDQGS